MEKIKKIINDKYNIFLILSLIGTIIYFIWLIIAEDSKPSDWLAMGNNYDWQFSDFFRHIIYASDLKNIYYNPVDSAFPPFAYLFFYILYRMNPTKYVMDQLHWRDAQNFQFNLLIFLMVEIIAIILLYIIIKKIFKKTSDTKAFIFLLVVLLSAPFLSGAIERGNPVLITLTLIISSLYLKDSENKIYRHLSLILLAMAIGFKIYPGIFIILWLKEKRFKDILFFILYCFIIVILPFAFTGGIESIFQYYNNIKFMNLLPPTDRWTSIELYYYSFCNALKLNYYAGFSDILRYLFFGIGIILSITTKEKWKAMLFLSSIMTVFVPNAYRYVSIYLLIPLIYYLCTKEDKLKIIDYIHLVLFGLIFTIPMWAININLPVNFAIFTPIYILNIMCIIEESIKLISNIKQGKIKYKLAQT